MSDERRYPGAKSVGAARPDEAGRGAPTAADQPAGDEAPTEAVPVGGPAEDTSATREVDAVGHGAEHGAPTTAVATAGPTVEDEGGDGWLFAGTPADAGPPTAGGRRPAAVAAVVALPLVLAAVAALVAFVVLRDAGPPPEQLAADVAARYLRAWERADIDAMEALVADPPADFAAFHRELADDLALERLAADPAAPVLDAGERRATVPVELDLALTGLETWSYGTELEVALLPAAREGGDGEAWQVVWDRATVHPALDEGERLDRAREWPARAPLQALDGTPLTGEGATALPGVAAHLLGSVRPLDEAAAAERGAPYQPGDEAGATGLQAAFDRRLAGAPAERIRVVAGEEPGEVLLEVGGEEPQPVRTTIDVGVQQAAEAALPEGGNAALVAVDVASGELRAVVNRPVAGFNRALDGAYPPGSTFKVVTAAALLAEGLAPSDPAPCPATANVGGRSFRNAEEEVLGEVPFRTAFAHSCNTSFVQLATALEPGRLQAAAEGFGFNREWELPIGITSGSYPDPAGEVELAASAIGQGRVTASPLQMAVVAATAASGAFREPQVVVPDEPVAAEPLPAGVAPVLQDLMRAVVTEGTGTAAWLPGEPVAGKTGTAEYGTDVPPRTHAWFIGSRGDLAFAVLVEDGGFGGEVAAPVAADFLARLG